VSFGNQGSAIRAISQRGWNPLNFNLLTVLPDTKNVVDLTTTLKPSCPLNVSNGLSNNYLDLLIEEEIKNEGRKKKFEQLKKEQQTRAQKLENLKKLTKVSSSQLAAINHYVLDENVLDVVNARHATQEAAQLAADQRKRLIEQKKNESLKQALRKFTVCPNGLTVPEMKALVTAASKSSDSPVKKKKQQLEEQLNREPRLGRVQQLAREYELTLESAARETNNDVAEALMALGVEGPVIPM
jgi:4-alpha-glucanotransferase